MNAFRDKNYKKVRLPVTGLMLLTATTVLAQEPCAVADDVLNAGYFDEASKLYQGLLAEAASKECAKDGLTKVRKKRAELLVASAKRLVSIDDLDGAQSKLNQALPFSEADPELAKTVVELLASIDSKQLAKDVERAKLLYQTGDTKAAREQLAKVVAVDPENADAKAFAKTMAAGQLDEPVKVRSETGDFDAAQTQREKILDDATGLAREDPDLPRGIEWANYRGRLITWTVYTAEIAIVLLALFLLARRYTNSIAQRPVLVVENFGHDQLDEKVGPGVARTLENALQKLGSEQPESLYELRVDRQAASVEVPTTILEKAPAAPWIAAILSVLPSLWPPTVFTLRGELLYSAEKGAGMALRLLKAGEVNTGITLWEEDFGSVGDEFDPAAHHRLADYAATWLFFNTAKRQMLLGTSDWRAYVCFQAGLHAADAGESGLARDMYVNALRIDTNLHAARLNLALLAPREQYDLVTDSLKYATKNADQLDLTRYRAKYSLAAIQLELGDKKTAQRNLGELIDEIDRLVASKDGWRERKSKQALRHYFKNLKPLAISGKAAADIEVGEHLATSLAPLRAIIAKPATPRTNYNVGCAYALAAGKQHEAKAAAARVVYYLDEAMRALRISFLQNPHLIDSVAADSSLAFPRTSGFQYEGKALKTYFAEMLEMSDSRSSGAVSIKDHGELAKLRNIGRKNAARLSKQNIKTFDQLVLELGQANARQKLSDQFKLGVEKISQWARTADMLRIAGLEVDDANLLNQAGLYSLSDLRQTTPGDLTELLADWAKTTGHKNPPPKSMVREWIKDAKRMHDKVS